MSRTEQDWESARQHAILTRRKYREFVDLLSDVPYGFENEYNEAVPESFMAKPYEKLGEELDRLIGRLTLDWHLDGAPALDMQEPGVEDSQPKPACPKGIGCLPESCGDCPYDKERDMTEQSLFAKRFPHRVGVVDTHYPECYKDHPSCAWRVGYEDGMRGVMGDMGASDA